MHWVFITNANYMDIIITIKFSEPPSDLKTKLNNEVNEKIKPLLPEASLIRVMVSKHKKGYKIEISTPFNKQLIKEETIDFDVDKCIKTTVERLVKKIKKYNKSLVKKEKIDTIKHIGEIYDQVHNKESKKINPYEELYKKEFAEYIPDEEFEIIRYKKFELKPMFPQEAILQMELLGHNFFLFYNAETFERCVVYKRNDGKYGLIE